MGISMVKTSLPGASHVLPFLGGSDVSVDMADVTSFDERCETSGSFYPGALRFRRTLL